MKSSVSIIVGFRVNWAFMGHRSERITGYLGGGGGVLVPRVVHAGSGVEGFRVYGVRQSQQRVASFRLSYGEFSKFCSL